MRIAITGSSGLIGSKTVRALQQRGDQIARLVRPGSKRSGIQWDPATGRIDADALEGCDAVINLAGESIASLWTPRRKRRILESRVKGTSLLATALARLASPPRVLISASGVNYYGNRPATESIDETERRGEGFLADVVERWEGAAEPARVAGIRTAHPRFGLVLARNGGALKFALPVFYAGIGGRLGSGKQVWSWVALADVVGSILHLIDHSVSGPVNVVAPNPVSNAEFTKTLGEVLHRPTWLAVPAFALRLAGGAADELILSGARIVPRKLIETGYQFRYPELRQALQAVLAGEVGP
jgi:uncharacterized protein (TIGR01777 family)